MEQMIAYCGLMCSDCEAYIATQANDQAALEEVAAQWRCKYSAPSITVEGVNCDGCLETEGRKCGYCRECEIRACAMQQKVINCAHCDRYTCHKLGEFFGFVPSARTTLDGIRASLLL
jgi:hypothetical protein